MSPTLPCQVCTRPRYILGLCKRHRDELVLAIARSRARQDKCGTLAGWNVHQRQGTPVCDACRAAKATYNRDLRLRHLEGKS